MPAAEAAGRNPEFRGADPSPASLPPAAVPYLPRGVRMMRDAAGEGFMLLAPERVFTLDGPAAAILVELDGTSSIAAIAARLAERYRAPRERVEADIRAMLAELMLKGVVAVREAGP